MASIEVGIRRNPGAFSDIGRPGVFDDNFGTNGTTVIVQAVVENAGNAPGEVTLSLYDLARGGDEGLGSAVAGDPRGRVTVPAGVWGTDDDITPGRANLSLEYAIGQPDILVDFVAEVRAGPGEGELLASRSFTVNPYTIPTAPELSAGSINVRVI